jgi:hypothetical protein
MIIPNPIKSINTIDRMLASGDFFMLSPFEQICLSHRAVRFAKSFRYRSAIPAGSKIAGEDQRQNSEYRSQNTGVQELERFGS